MPARSETECVARVANWELLGVSHIATTIVATSESRGLVGLAGVRTVSTTLEWGLTNAPQVALKGVLESRIGGGVLGAATQGLTDFLFHPELTSQQRAGRVLVVGAVAVAAAAATPLLLGAIGLGTAGIVATAASAAEVGVAGWATQTFLFPRLGLGD